MTKTLLAAVAGLLLAWLAMPADEALAATCTVGSATLNFGAVDTLDSTSNAATTDLTISCSDISSSTVSACVNLGEGSGGTSGSLRLMTGNVHDAGIRPLPERGGDDGVGRDIDERARRRGIGHADGERRRGQPGCHHLRRGAGKPADGVDRQLRGDGRRHAGLRRRRDRGLRVPERRRPGDGDADGRRLRGRQLPGGEASDLDFGTTGLITSALEADADISITCTPGAT